MGIEAIQSYMDSNRVLDIVLQMRDELDHITLGAIEALDVDASRVAIGGMSAGGMAAIARLCRPHRFRGAILLATTGDWASLAARPNMDAPQQDDLDRLSPMSQLAHWRPIPVLAVHCQGDAWIPWAGSSGFYRRSRH